MKRFTKLFALLSASLLIAPIASSVVVLDTVSAQQTSLAQGTRLLSLGATLNEQEANQTRQLLNATDVPAENVIYVDGVTINNYLNDGSTAATDVYSSAYIEQFGPGHGIQVQIVTPENIQQVSASTYQNAAITAGVSNVTIRIATLYPVTGEGALTGVYALLEDAGVQLNQQDIQVAQKEIQVIGNVEENTQLTQDQINLIISQIKREINQYILDNGSITDEVILEIVQRNFADVEIDEATLQEIIDLIREFAETEAASDEDTQNQIDQSLLNRPWSEVLATTETVATVDDLLAGDRPDFSDQAVYHPMMQAFLNRFYELAEAGESTDFLYSHTFIFENMTPNMDQADTQALNWIRTLIYQYTEASTLEMRQAEFASMGVNFISLQEQWLQQIADYNALATNDPVLYELFTQVANASGLAPEVFIYGDVQQADTIITTMIYSDQISHFSIIDTYSFNTLDDSIAYVDATTGTTSPVANSFDFLAAYGVAVENLYQPFTTIPADFTIPGYEAPVNEEDLTNDAEDSVEETLSEEEATTEEPVDSVVEEVSDEEVE
ncbi:DUF1002 domain-containing protein [Fundicoccus culcitae]|uniref:DUF1002 domain-containing protein n=1 Tax=Fundicoccus culcitae TaxID=2969821 RepID=A0ABY5P6Z2_9LACT|nr:DUF1002 domain-containing protein [Fundicoccus culcitae]UUX34250.1 DUF1002 domain-containing protein [Fundicoccus culcitae]